MVLFLLDMCTIGQSSHELIFSTERRNSSWLADEFISRKLIANVPGPVGYLPQHPYDWHQKVLWWSWRLEEKGSSQSHLLISGDTNSSEGPAGSSGTWPGIRKQRNPRVIHAGQCLQHLLPPVMLKQVFGLPACKQAFSLQTSGRVGDASWPCGSDHCCHIFASRPLK